MFQVGRYDPQKQKKEQESRSQKRQSKDRKEKKPKRKREDHGQSRDQKSLGALGVIAPDETDATKKTGLLSELHQSNPSTSALEAFDDLDLLLLETHEGDGDEVDQEAEDHQPEDVGEAGSVEIRTALKMAELPIDEAATLWKLAPFLVEKLRDKGFERFFPIQALAIADVVLSDTQFQQQDVCITAATGSGKTLSYALPILHALSRRPRGCRRQLRALVVLPSRDLATQVHEVFQDLVEHPSCDLKVGLSIGQTNFTAEQMSLTVDKDSDDPENLRRWLSLDPGNLEIALRFARRSRGCTFDYNMLSSPSSAVDILVCTPGRMVDHLDSTPGFSLEHLQFLVVDEADRLLNQRYHNWMDRVLESQKREESTSRILHVPRKQLRKFLVSATLTRDPQKLAALRLNNPKHLNAHQLKIGSRSRSQKMYSMPESLKEYTVECTAAQKPLVLLALLLEFAEKRSADGKTESHLVVVFTSSLDATHRLARLLQLLWSFVDDDQQRIGKVAEFSSAMNQAERSALVRQCNQGSSPVSVIVCSDGMSRGMDLNNVQAVLHYDVPSATKTYVHRSGRTARAGAPGTTVTLLKGAGQAGQFAKMRRLVQAPERVVNGYRLQKSLVRGLPYRECVAALREVLEAEECGELRRTEELPADYLPNLADDDEGDNEGPGVSDHADSN